MNFEFRVNLKSSSSFIGKLFSLSSDPPIQSHLESCLTIVAEHKIGHWLISTVDLHLYEACFVTLAILTLKEALVGLTLGFDFLSGPISSFVAHIVCQCDLSLLLDVIRC